MPILLQILSGAHDARALMPKGGVIGLPGRSSIEISIPGGVIGGEVSFFRSFIPDYLSVSLSLQHPFHLHGVGVVLLYLRLACTKNNTYPSITST